MSDCNAVSTPMEQSFKAAAIKAPVDCTATDHDMREYQGMIGGLMFAAVCTRPDIAFAVTTLAQFASKPTSAHAHAVKTESSATFGAPTTATSPTQEQVRPTLRLN